MGGCPADVLEWYDAMGLPKRVAALRKNASAAAADAVLVAEAVSYYYPKMVQLHSYQEQNNTAARLSNWRHLNTKVLKAMHCDLSEDQMMRFASRQSESEVVEYLRELRIRLPSFEPLYLAEFHAGNDAISQKMIMERMMKNMPQRSPSTIGSEASSTYSISEDNESVASSAMSMRRGTVSSSSPRQPAVAGTNLHRQGSGVSTTSVVSGPVRRPSSVKSGQILEARRGREEVARRASLMTTNDIEAQFKALSGKIKNETTMIATETDHLDKKSQTLDAQMAALQKQNRNELAKIEKRLSVLRLEQTEAETGKSVAIDDNINYTVMVDPSKNSFAQELSAALRETAMDLNSLDVARGISRRSPPKGMASPPLAPDSRYESSPTNNIPFGGRAAIAAVAELYDDYGSDGENESRSEGSSTFSDEDESGSEYETDDSDDPPPPPPPPRVDASHASSSGPAKAAPSAPMSVKELDKSKINPRDTASSPPAPPPVIRGALSSEADHIKHRDLHTHFQDEDETSDLSDDEDAAFAALSAMKAASTSMRSGGTMMSQSPPAPAAGISSPPPRPPVDAVSPKPSPKPVIKKDPFPAAGHRRCYDKQKQRFYYVNLATGESKWRAPSEGLVLCTDKENREYLFDVVTEKSTWVKR